MTLTGLIELLFNLIYLTILGRIILSFVIPLMQGRVHPIVMNIYDVLTQMTEPILAPIRRVLPTFGMLDFSPLVAIILLQIIQVVLISTISR